MAHGGARARAGRKPGQGTKINEEARQKAAEGGLMPLDYMLALMRNDGVDANRRDDMAKAAAPYVHAKLTSVEHGGSVDSHVTYDYSDKPLTDDEWEQAHGTRLATPGRPTNGAH